MKKRFFIMVSAMLLVLLGTWLFLNRMRHLAQPADDPRQGMLERKRTPPLAENRSITDSLAPQASLLGAKDSSVYLTQAQQEYRLVERKENTPDVARAKKEGADAKVTLRVVDSEGKPVADADVQVAFFYRGSYPINGKTDLNGFFTASHRSGSDVQFHAIKEGYYRTHRTYWFYREGKPCAKDGRWQPWNPTLEVVLKEKRKPIPMYQNYIETMMPAGTNRLGFDFLVGDWVVPHGKGTIADMWYVYDENFIDRDNFFIKLSFAFEGEKNGCYMRKIDNFSQLISEHEASDTDFAPSKVCVIEQEKGKYTKELRFAEDDYMVFRIRTKTDEQGKIISSQYGKIYGPVGVPHRWSKKFSFTYYLNPTPNDRNLEYDPQKNLTPDGQRHTMNRNLP